MIDALTRKMRQVAGDPVLRRWLLRRLFRMEKPPPAFTAGSPPYLQPAGKREDGPDIPRWNGPTGNNFSDPATPITIELPGETVGIDPKNPVALFTRKYADLESRLAAHRFAWVPIAGDKVDPDWVAQLWACWTETFGGRVEGWPWHAYTAAERAINIIDFSKRFGLPGEETDTLEVLVRHAETIRRNLEYFGEHYTSNHLANNGRGLLRIGLALGLDDHAETGARILVAEAGRIFGRSGMLREGSTHYHLLATRNYIDAWLAADAAKIGSAGLLGEIAERAVAVIPGLCLPGGMPLIGDISPDAPPEYFSGLMARKAPGPDWLSMLDHGSRQNAEKLLGSVTPVSPDRLAENGWHRFGGHDWQVLAYIPTDGWPPMPGHGHQDLGSFELHDGPVPVVVDPGRGSYGDDEYASASVHSGLTIDGLEPAPRNRPYYANRFRRHIAGAPPTMLRTRQGRILRSEGFARLKGVGAFTREWRFSDRSTEIADRVEGKGTRRICRRFFIPGVATATADAAILEIDGKKYRLAAGNAPGIEPATRWSGYGRGKPASIVSFEETATLPFEGKTILERHE